MNIIVNYELQFKLQFDYKNMFVVLICGHPTKYLKFPKFEATVYQ